MAEGERIEEEIEEFSSRAAKDVASLVTEMSDIEDDSDRITKKIESIDEEIFSLAREKKIFRVVDGKQREAGEAANKEGRDGPDD